MAPEFIGLGEAAARRLAADHGMQLRLVDLDKLADGRVVLTADLRPDRVTVYISDRTVTRADAG